MACLFRRSPFVCFFPSPSSGQLKVVRCADRVRVVTAVDVQDYVCRHASIGTVCNWYGRHNITYVVGTES